MDGSLHIEAINDEYVGNFMPIHSPVTVRRKSEERLPFSISIVRDDATLQKAVEIRQQAYARHLPEFAEKLRAPEPYDHDPTSVILIAESNLDGSPLGTMRIQSNRDKPLVLEQSIELPAKFRGASLAEATRLGVSQKRVGMIVKTALFKAFYLACVEAEIEWMVIAGRAPMDRQYEGLLFEDVDPDGAFVPLRHAGNIPHRVMAFEVATAEARWRAADHKLYDFVFRTHHPDIDVSGAGSLWQDNMVDVKDSLRIMGARP